MVTLASGLDEAMEIRSPTLQMHAWYQHANLDLKIKKMCSCTVRVESDGHLHFKIHALMVL